MDFKRTVVVSPRRTGKTLMMNKFDVVISFERLAEQKAKWSSAHREFITATDRIMALLLHQAAAVFMSVDEVAKAAGMTKTQVRAAMRKHGLNPRDGKRMLSKHAASALETNADLLGIKPHEMDLTSPLAYLPMGEEMRRQMADSRVSRVTEFPETDLLPITPEMLRSAYTKGWDDRSKETDYAPEDAIEAITTGAWK